MKSLKLLIIGAGALVLTALPAAATPVGPPSGFPPAGASDALFVYNAAGQIVGSATSFEEEAPNTVREINTNLADPAQIGNYILIFDPQGRLDDVVGIENGVNPNGSPHAEFAYISDPLDDTFWRNVFRGQQVGAFTEDPTNGITLNISFFINPNGAANGGQAWFFSDGNVPDGGSAVALLGIALAGIEVLRRKFRAA